MLREWTVRRGAPVGDAIVGVFDTGGGTTCSSLERLGVEIQEGRFRLTLTVSARAAAGSLWAPYPDHRLPLLNAVPGRTGIRVHAMNNPGDSEGCLGVGTDHTQTAIEHSRPALVRIVNELRDAERDGDEVWLTVRSAA